MASKVNPTPTLYGEDAERFIKHLNTPSTKEELNMLKKAEETFKKIKYVK